MLNWPAEAKVAAGIQAKRYESVARHSSRAGSVAPHRIIGWGRSEDDGFSLVEDRGAFSGGRDSAEIPMAGQVLQVRQVDRVKEKRQKLPVVVR